MFLTIWLIGAVINMWVGVAKAGYIVHEELPTFGVIFAMPAVALLVLGNFRER